MRPFDPRALGLILILAAAVGCASAQPPATQTRPTNVEPANYSLRSLLVRDFQSACDTMARSLMIQPVIQAAQKPPVISIRPVENKTGMDIDPEIFQETIRVKLIKNSGGKVFFRDDKTRRDIVMERSQQASEVKVETIDDMVATRFERERTPGGRQVTGFGGAGGTQGQATLGQTGTTMKEGATVSGGIAQVDYFLRGIVFSTVETRADQPNQGRRFWQFQFRLVDANNGLVVWEDIYRTNAEGNL